MFQDKVIWIVGASSGFGAALAQAFGKTGARIILSARRENELEKIKAIMVGTQTQVLPLDLEKHETFSDKTREAIAFFGHVDMIVLAGAVAQNAPVVEVHPDIERKIMEVDYFSYTQLTHCILPHFLERNQGHFIVISGVLARVTLPNRSSYAAAKAALHGYYGCLRSELAKTNIDITLLVPSAMQTDLSLKALRADGNVPETAQSVTTGCSLEKAAQQSLQAIERKRAEALIGNWDMGSVLWKLSLFFPNYVAKLLVKKARG